MKKVTVYKVESSRCKKCEYGMQIDGRWGCAYAIIMHHSRTIGSKVPKGYCDKFTERQRNRTKNEQWINTLHY